MKIAMPVCGGRVSTVFDATDEIMLIEGEPGDTQRRCRAKLPVNDELRKATALVDLGVDVLICGAVSGPLERMIEITGIRVLSFVKGGVEDVLEAYYQGRLEDSCYTLPGCHHRRCRRLRGGRQGMTSGLHRTKRNT